MSQRVHFGITVDEKLTKDFFSGVGRLTIVSPPQIKD
jgi:hypothetical protein